MTNFCLSRVWKSLWKLKPGLKTGVKNNISVWSEMGSRFGKPGGTAPPRIPGSTSSGKGTRAKGPNVRSLSRFDWHEAYLGVCYSPLDGMLVHRRVTPLAVCRWYPFILFIHRGEAGDKEAIRQNNFAGAQFG